jgi:WD40 repeat protein
LQLFIIISKLFHVGIHCMKWCSDSECLLVGTATGVACWRLYYNTKRQHKEELVYYPNEMQFFEHPHKHPVHSLDISPQGRLFMALTDGEDVVYVWDTTTSTSSPVYCFDSANALAQHCSWSPSGLHVAVTDTKGGVVLVDTYSWKHSPCYQQSVPISTVCWLGESVCLLHSIYSMDIYTCELLLTQQKLSHTIQNKRLQRYNAPTVGAIADISAHSSSNLLSIAVSSTPFTLSSHGMSVGAGEVIGIQEIVSEARQGKFLAMSFTKWRNHEDVAGK